MKQITININNDKYKIFKAFIESLDYAKIVSEKEEQKRTKKAAILNGIHTGLGEVELIKKGKLKGLSLNEVLDEL